VHGSRSTHAPATAEIGRRDSRAVCRHATRRRRAAPASMRVDDLDRALRPAIPVRRSHRTSTCRGGRRRPSAWRLVVHTACDRLEPTPVAPARRGPSIAPGGRTGVPHWLVRKATGLEEAQMTDQGASQPAAAGWKKDPTGRHFGRYWDGSAWTDHVVNAEKVTSTDPYQSAPEPSMFPDSPPTMAPPRVSAPTVRGPVPTAPAGRRNPVRNARRTAA
jgi:hypothetical protein